MALNQTLTLPDGVRPDLRQPDELRPVSYTWDIAPQAHGSILFRCGRTQVLCSAMIEEGVPRWMKEQQVTGGWITAEYSMLPYSTEQRKPRDISKGKLDGRSQEIQRLIGRSIRAAVDLEKIGPRTIWLDCDVLAADGGTRTTAITGVFLALKLAVSRLQKRGSLKENPLAHPVAATSVGIHAGQILLDLCYLEDRDAAVDMNLVMTGDGRIVEIQGSGEESTFSPEELHAMLELGRNGIRKLFQIQEEAWRQAPV
jgi:ribonuclease PH